MPHTNTHTDRQIDRQIRGMNNRRIKWMMYRLENGKIREEEEENKNMLNR